MSSESEVTEFEQERIQHPTGHCEDCGCPLEICCKPKKPVVEVEVLENFCKGRIEEIKEGVKAGIYATPEEVKLINLAKDTALFEINNILKTIHLQSKNQVAKK